MLLRVCVRLYLDASECVCRHVCLSSVCSCVNVYLRVCSFTCMCVPTCAWGGVFVQVVRVQLCAGVSVCGQVCVHSCARLCRCVYVQVYTGLCMCRCVYCVCVCRRVYGRVCIVYVCQGVWLGGYRILGHRRSHLRRGRRRKIFISQAPLAVVVPRVHTFLGSLLKTRRTR